MELDRQEVIEAVIEECRTCPLAMTHQMLAEHIADRICGPEQS